MKKIISFTIVISLLAACSKNTNQQVTVTGRLMQSCDTPAANKDALIRLPGGGILSNPSTTLNFTTDENGYFEVTHNEFFSDFSVRTSAAHSVLEVESLGGDKKELGEVYIFFPETQFYINLNVEEAYTNQDTLYYPDYNSSSGFSWAKVSGPFNNGVIDTIHSMISSSAMPVNYNSSDVYEASLKYYVNDFASGGEKKANIPIVHCQDDYQTVTLTID